MSHGLLKLRLCENDVLLNTDGKDETSDLEFTFDNLPNYYNCIRLDVNDRHKITNINKRMLNNNYKCIWSCGNTLIFINMTNDYECAFYKIKYTGLFYNYKTGSCQSIDEITLPCVITSSNNLLLNDTCSIINLERLAKAASYRAYYATKKGIMTKGAIKRNNCYK